MTKHIYIERLDKEVVLFQWLCALLHELGLDMYSCSDVFPEGWGGGTNTHHVQL